MTELDNLKTQLDSANNQLYNLLRQCQGQQKELETIHDSLYSIHEKVILALSGEAIDLYQIGREIEKLLGCSS